MLLFLAVGRVAALVLVLRLLDRFGLCLSLGFNLWLGSVLFLRPRRVDEVGTDRGEFLAAVGTVIHTLRNLPATMRAIGVSEVFLNHAHFAVGHGAFGHMFAGIEHTEALWTNHSATMQGQFLDRHLHVLRTLRTYELHKFRSL